MKKIILINQVKNHLLAELSILLEAANQAHSAAVDEQSIAETQYDTLAIEAGYLAEGQSKRALTIQTEVERLKQLSIRDFTSDMPISLGALVQLAKDEAKQHWFFILPAAAGYKGSFDDSDFTVITPQSPMGNELIDKYQDDDIQLLSGKRELNDFIVKVF